MSASRLSRLVFVATVIATLCFRSAFAEAQPEVSGKDKAAVALSAAAIITLIIQMSRSSYHAAGRPCACPEDLNRGGRRCGATSAYSRPGGARPLCYPTDVSSEIIEKFRSSLVREP